MRNTSTTNSSTPLLGKLFFEHPSSVGETYLEHLRSSSGFSARMILGGTACLVHGLLPCFFVKTGSGQIRYLHDRMIAHRDKRGQEDTNAAPAELTGADLYESDRTFSSPASKAHLFVMGILLAIVLAAFSMEIAIKVGLPPILIVLLLGVTLRSIAPSVIGRLQPGVAFCARKLLQLGIALLGLRVVVGDVAALGVQAILMVLTSVLVTMLVGLLLGKLLRQPRDAGSIAATSVAICGASAAMAASALVPDREGLRREISVIIVTVSFLGSVAMVLYPWLARTLGFDATQTSILLGASIHDVAQVAGAGLTVSNQVAVEAISVKMVRIACLMPTILALGWWIRKAVPQAPGRIRASKAIPTFFFAFVAFAALASVGLISGRALALGQQFSTWALMVAVAAVGLSTSLGDLRAAPLKLILVLVIQSAMQVGFVVLLLKSGI